MTAATRPPVADQIVAAMREHEAEHPEGFTGYEVVMAVPTATWPAVYISLRELEAAGVIVSWQENDVGYRRYRRAKP